MMALQEPATSTLAARLIALVGTDDPEAIAARLWKLEAGREDALRCLNRVLDHYVDLAQARPEAVTDAHRAIAKDAVDQIAKTLDEQRAWARQYLDMHDALTGVATWWAGKRKHPRTGVELTVHAAMAPVVEVAQRPLPDFVTRRVQEGR